jgi:hypothetical protein
MRDAQTQRAEFTDEIERRVNEAVEAFQELELAQMRKGEIEARARLAEVKKTVDEKQSNARARLASARSASAAAWEESKKGLQSAWTELSEAVERARHELTGEVQGETA